MTEHTKKDLLPKLQGSENPAKVSKPVVEEPTEAQVLNAEIERMAKSSGIPPVPDPPKKVVAPDPDPYWVDTYGNIWRQHPEPEIILTYQANLKVVELNAIVDGLLRLSAGG